MKNIALPLTFALAACTSTWAQEMPPAAAPAAVQAKDPRPQQPKGRLGVAWVQTRIMDAVIDAFQKEVGTEYKILPGSRQSTGSGGEQVEILMEGDIPVGDAPPAYKKLQAIARQMILEANPVQTARSQTIDIDFPGGTSEEFLELLFPKNLPMNVVYASPESRTVQMPAVKARQLSRDSIMNLMLRLQEGAGVAASCTFQWLTLNGNSESEERITLLARRNDPISGMRARPGIDDPANKEPTVLRITAADATSDSAKRDQERLQAQVISAIDDGITLRGGPSTEFKIKLNPATGILFVQGTSKEKNLVTAVVKAMMQGQSHAEAAPFADAPAASPPAEAAPPAATPSRPRDGNRRTPTPPPGNE